MSALAATAAVTVWTRAAAEWRDDPELRAIALRAAADANDALGQSEAAARMREEAAALQGRV